jgi:hypothetical protein
MKLKAENRAAAMGVPFDPAFFYPAFDSLQLWI